MRVKVSGALTLGWSFLAALVAGAAIWCTHFVAMLAYLVNTNVAFDPVLTIASLLIATSGAYLGLIVASLDKSKATPLLGGVIVGLSIGLMHYVGMLAFRVDGVIHWEPRLVVASIVMSSVLSGLSMVMVRGQLGPRYAKGAFMVLILAILSLHFTGMAALQVMPLAPSQPTLGSGAVALAIATALVGFLVIGAGALAYIIDSQTRRDAGERLASMAMTDLLTGLPNSRGFETELKRRIAKCGPDEHLLVMAVGFPGLDAVKQRFGREIFDQAVKAIVRKLLDARKTDVFLARSGSGKILAFCSAANLGENGARPRRLFEAVCGQILVDDIVISPDPRIGVASFPDDSADADVLVRHATLALSQAIADPLEPIARFESSADAVTTRRQALADDMRGALHRGEFELFYQPQVRIENREVIGHEALLRWRHPVLGMVSPAEFIPIAEQTGLIVDIGDWTLQTACMTATTWPAAWLVAVNLSPLQLRQSNLAERVALALTKSGLSPERLELELTESLLIDDRSRAQNILGSIRALKVRLALDDFGAGYSSMDVLRHFPFDKIKLDKTFVDDVEANPRSLAILRAMLAMGRSLSITVLAEGIETERQLAILQAEGCVKMQGYLTGRPVPVDKIVFDHPQRLAS